MLTAGRLDLTQRHPLGGFYDAQAESLLDLHWDVAPEELATEAFVVDGKAYEYQGPVPALFRLPIVALTDRYDGRLTQISMLAAFAVTMVFASRLSWQIRRLFGSGGPVTTGEAIAAGGFMMLLGTGSALMFLAGQAYIYHEAIIWGVALALGAYDALVRHLSGGSRRALLWTGVFASLAMLTRASTGLGPVLAVGVVIGLRAVGALRGRRQPERRRPVWPPTMPLGLVAAAVVPLLLYASVNHAKFGTFFSVPVSAQVASTVDPTRAAFLRENGDSFFGLQYLPTAAVQYLRPDALALERQFPFVDLPTPAKSFGGVRFDRIDRASSVPASMPWMVVLGAVGVGALIRRRRSHPRAAAALAPPLLGALLALGVTITIAYVAQRYLGDFIPLLVVAGLVGLHDLVRRGREGGAWARTVGVVVALTALVGCYVNVSLALVYERQYGFVSESLRAELIAWQLDVDRTLPGDQAPRLRSIRAGGALPRSVGGGDLVVVGDCDGLYQFDGDTWRPVERTNTTGRFRLELRLTDVAPGVRYELVREGQGSAQRTLALETRPNRRVVFVFTSPGSRAATGAAHEIGVDEKFVFDVVMDRRLNMLQVVVDGRVLLGRLYNAPDDHLRVADLPGRLVNRPLEAPVCKELVRGR